MNAKTKLDFIIDLSLVNNFSFIICISKPFEINQNHIHMRRYMNIDTFEFIREKSLKKAERKSENKASR